MLRRILTFLVFILLIGGVSALVYMNAQETSFRLAPELTFTLPLGVLMLAGGCAGAVVMFLIALMREGRHALRDWRVHRELRAAQRNVEHVAEARSLTLAGDYKRARALLTKATQKREPEIGDVIDYADTFLLEDDPAQARRVLEEGQKDFGNEPLLLFALARACRAASDTPAAISALERALAVYPRSARILTSLRDLLFETESWNRAVEVQKRIVELKPDDASERNWLLGARFEAAMQMGTADREAALKSLCNDAPEFIPAAIERARLVAAAGDRRRAMKILEKAARLRPRTALLDELEHLCGTDEPSRIAKLYTKLVTSDAANAGLRARAAHFLVATGRTDDAAALLTANTENANSPSVQAAWAEVHSAKNRNNEALAAYKKAVSARGGDKQAYSCEVCGAQSSGWQTRCEQCRAWGMLEAL